jgi:hypothetical protein
MFKNIQGREKHIRCGNAKKYKEEGGACWQWKCEELLIIISRYFSRVKYRRTENVKGWRK